MLDDNSGWLFPGPYDLDLNQAPQTADITFIAENPKAIRFSPSENAKLAYWGNTLPKPNDCAFLSLSKETLIIETTPVKKTDIPGYNQRVIPAFFCYRTDEGRLGVLEFNGTYYNEKADLLYLMILVETWQNSNDEFILTVSPVCDEETTSSAITGTTSSSDNYAVIASGNITLPNGSTFNFISGQIGNDTSTADLVLEYDPDHLDGCFISLSKNSAVLGKVTGALTDIDIQRLSTQNDGCLSIARHNVYYMKRNEAPDEIVLFRVVDFEQESITLQYIVEKPKKENQ